MATADIKEGQISPKGKRKSTGKSHSKMSDGGATGGGVETVEFSLSDPEQLARQLDRVDLTEEESDELLREAYKVNKQLKMMLKQKQDKVAASLRSQSASSCSSSQRGGGTSILPPIHAKSGIAAVPTRSHKAYGHGYSGSKTASGSSAGGKGKSGKSRSPNQAPNRPQWDDRFSFS